MTKWVFGVLLVSAVAKAQGATESGLPQSDASSKTESPLFASQILCRIGHDEGTNRLNFITPKHREKFFKKYGENVGSKTIFGAFSCAATPVSDADPKAWKKVSDDAILGCKKFKSEYSLEEVSVNMPKTVNPKECQGSSPLPQWAFYVYLDNSTVSVDPSKLDENQLQHARAVTVVGRQLPRQAPAAQTSPPANQGSAQRQRPDTADMVRAPGVQNAQSRSSSSAELNQSVALRLEAERRRLRVVPAQAVSSPSHAGAPRMLGRASLVVGTGAVVALGVGWIFHGRAADSLRELENGGDCINMQCIVGSSGAQALADGAGFAKRRNWMLGVGSTMGLAAAVGGAWYWLDPPTPAKPAWTALCLTDQCYLQIRGNF